MPRADTIRIAQSYIMRGLVGWDWPHVLLAKDCSRTECGWSTGISAAEIHQTSAGMKGLGGVRLIKWVVQGNTAVAFMELAIGPRLIPIAEFFRISGGLLKEVRPNFPTPQMPGNGLGAAVAPKTAKKPTGIPAVNLVDAYLKGLAKGSLAGVKLGPDVVVTENGEIKGNKLEAVTKHLAENWLGKVTGVTVQDWVVEGEEVVAVYVATMREGRPRWTTQYFRIYDGMIRETLANFGGGPTPEEAKTPHAPPPAAAKRKR